MSHVLYNYTVLSKMSGKCLQNTWTYAYESFFHNIQFCICFLYILNNTGKIKLYSHSITTNIHIHCSSNFASDKIIFFFFKYTLLHVLLCVCMTWNTPLSVDSERQYHILCTQISYLWLSWWRIYTALRLGSGSYNWNTWYQTLDARSGNPAQCQHNKAQSLAGSQYRTSHLNSL